MTGRVFSLCYAAMMLLRFCGSASISLCGFCFADAACRSLPMSLYLLIFLWFRNFWGLILANVSMVRMCPCVLIMKNLLRVATVGSCSVWQHGCVSSFASSRSCGATAATFVVAFVMLAAFAFVYSATACGHPDPAGGSWYQSDSCQRLLMCRRCLHHLPKLRQLHLFGCIMQQLLCVSGYPLLSRG